MFKLIAKILKIRIVAADGIVLELPATVIEFHDPRAVNGFFDVEVVKKDRCLRVLIGALIDTAAGGQTEQTHTQACRGEERFEFHSVTSIFRKITGFSRSKLGRDRDTYKLSQGSRPYWNVMLLRMMSGIGVRNAAQISHTNGERMSIVELRDILDPVVADIPIGADVGHDTTNHTVFDIPITLQTSSQKSKPSAFSLTL